jgi:Fuc2NAc and GlcNAc transferase
VNSVDWLIVVLAFGAGLALTPLVRVYSLRRGLIDMPGPRRSHVRPVARGGGVAIAISVLICGALLSPGLSEFRAMAVGVAGFTLIGWLDDHRPVPVVLRLVPELLLTAALLIWVWPSVWGSLLLAVAILMVVWWVNLFNFMDGSDGLAAAQACFIAVALGVAFLHSGEGFWAAMALVLAAATAAFLLWNHPPARIFLGDAGSLMLGWSLAFLGLIGLREDVLTLSLCLILSGPFLVDASLTLGWRVVRGRQWYTPHRDHAYQILIRCGWSHRRVLGGMLSVNLFLVAPAAGLVLARSELGVTVAVMVLTILTGVWSIVQYRFAGGQLSG